jgi:hypothetical protein
LIRCAGSATPRLKQCPFDREQTRRASRPASLRRFEPGLPATRALGPPRDGSPSTRTAVAHRRRPVRHRYARTMSAVGRHDHVLVHCPRCNERATIDRRSGVLRITCSSCGFINEERGQRSEETRLARRWALNVYNSGDTFFGARLWLETDCCGGRRLWALNARHLEYLAAFVRSKDRTREFPSLPGIVSSPTSCLSGWWRRSTETRCYERLIACEALSSSGDCETRLSRSVWGRCQPGCRRAVCDSSGDWPRCVPCE